MRSKNYNNSRNPLIFMQTMNHLSLARRRLDNDHMQKALINREMEGISALDLSYNNINEHLSFDGCCGLVKLRLAHCHFNALPFLPSPGKIRNLDLSYNQLVDVLLEDNDSLEFLRLQGNSIRNFSFTDLSSLRVLILGDDLVGNDLTSLPASIGQLYNLEELRASRNNIGMFPNQIIQCSRLLLLDLSHNQITEIPANLSKLNRLEIVDLSFNSIVCLSDEMRLPCSLSSLNLTGNHIQVIPSNLPLDICVFSLNDCFFKWCAMTIQRPLSLKCLSANVLVNCPLAPSPPCNELVNSSFELCARCPMRLMFPWTKTTIPGVLHGHHNVPVLKPLCSSRCQLMPRAHVNDIIMLSEHDLVDL